MTKKILSVILTFVMLFSVTAGSLTVDAASKNTVKTSISKVESKAKGFKVTWKKKSGIKGYQIQYSTSSKFKKSSTKTKTVSSAKTKSATISKLKGCNTKYYVRVRTYKVSKGKKIYSSWSSVKKATTLKHKYSKATCTKPKTCKYCNKTSGKKLGHRYSDATCTKAKTCTRCKNTSGKALGHNWCDATCTDAETCSRCEQTSGTSLGHNYSSPTCTSPKTCKTCGKTSGMALGHSYSANIVSPTCERIGYTLYTCECGDSYISDYKNKVFHSYLNYVCTMCGTVDKSHAYEYLIEWVKTNGKYDGMNITYVIQENDSQKYSISYSPEYDNLFVDCYLNPTSSTDAYTMLLLDSYFYGLSFYGDSIYGYINPGTYSQSMALTYSRADCKTFTSAQMLSLAKTSVDTLIESLRYCLLINEIPISIADLGFVSY